MLIAQITDLHITLPGRPLQRRVDTGRYLQKAVAKLQALDPAPNVLLITGDLVESGTPEEYDYLRSLLAPLRLPIFVIPGNHDARDALRQQFLDQRYLPQQGFLHYAIDDFPVRMIGLDSVIPRETEGELCAVRLAWLDQVLHQAPSKPTIIFMHHPPFATGLEHWDECGFRNPDELATVVRRHTQIERIVCGHLHRSIQSRFAGTLALTCPSTAHQIEFDLKPNSPLAFIMEPPGLMLHIWNGRNMATHTLYTERYDGPYVYRTSS